MTHKTTQESQLKKEGGAVSEPRPEKVAIVDEIRDRVGAAEAVMVTEYRGLTVSELATLRLAMRPAGGKYKVYKNTLAKRAVGEDQPELAELLVGPTALAFIENTPEGETGDVVAVAKALKDFAKTSPELIVKGGIFEGNFIDADGLNALADIEPREVLLSKFAGLLAAPMQRMAGLLQAVPRDFAYGLKALIDIGGAPGAPADAPATADEATDAAPAVEDTPDEDTSAEDTPAEEAAEPAAEAPEITPEETASADAEQTEESEK
jgi:large subunit ribosomal protein L10